MSDTTPPRSQPASGPLATLFLNHPATVDETYFQHMRFAFSFAFWLIIAGGAALIHALIPALCETTASRQVKALHAKISGRSPTSGQG